MSPLHRQVQGQLFPLCLYGFLEKWISSFCTLREWDEDKLRLDEQEV